jgi:hypothetical protein
MKIVYGDEADFTFNALRKKAWSRKTNAFIAFIAAIGEDGGLEAYSLHSRLRKS